jgi:hypothetical protein
MGYLFIKRGIMFHYDNLRWRAGPPVTIEQVITRGMIPLIITGNVMAVFHEEEYIQFFVRSQDDLGVWIPHTTTILVYTMHDPPRTPAALRECAAECIEDLREDGTLP